MIFFSDPKRILSFFLLFACVVAFAACEEGPPEPEVDESTAFLVQPVITVYGASNKKIEVNRVFLGIGEVQLQRAGENNHTILSTGDPLSLVFNLSKGRDSISVPDIFLEEGGRYFISILLEPLADQERNVTGQKSTSAGNEGSKYNRSEQGLSYKDGEEDPDEEYSVAIEGILASAGSPCDTPLVLRSEPEPLPWQPLFDPNEPEEKVSFGHEKKMGLNVPFSYESSSTGVLRLGEVKLDSEHHELQINIYLDPWLEDTLAEKIEALERLKEESSGASGEKTEDIKLNQYDEGGALERVFRSISTEVE